MTAKELWQEMCKQCRLDDMMSSTDSQDVTKPRLSKLVLESIIRANITSTAGGVLFSVTEMAWYMVNRQIQREGENGSLHTECYLMHF